MKLGQDWAQNTITALLNRTHRSYRPWFRIQIAEGIGMFTRETENATQMSSDVLTWQRFWLHLQANLWRPLPTVVRSRPNVRDLDSTTLGLGPNHRVSPWWRFEPSPFVAGGHNASKKQTNKNWTSHNASTIAIHTRLTEHVLQILLLLLTTTPSHSLCFSHLSNHLTTLFNQKLPTYESVNSICKL